MKQFFIKFFSLLKKGKSLSEKTRVLGIISLCIFTAYSFLILLRPYMMGWIFMSKILNGRVMFFILVIGIVFSAVHLILSIVSFKKQGILTEESVELSNIKQDGSSKVVSELPHDMSKRKNGVYEIILYSIVASLSFLFLLGKVFRFTGELASMLSGAIGWYTFALILIIVAIIAVIYAITTTVNDAVNKGVFDYKTREEIIVDKENKKNKKASYGILSVIISVVPSLTALILMLCGCEIFKGESTKWISVGGKRQIKTTSLGNFQMFENWLGILIVVMLFLCLAIYITLAICGRKTETNLLPGIATFLAFFIPIIYGFSCLLVCGAGTSDASGGSGIYSGSSISYSFTGLGWIILVMFLFTTIVSFINLQRCMASKKTGQS